MCGALICDASPCAIMQGQLGLECYQEDDESAGASAGEGRERHPDVEEQTQAGCLEIHKHIQMKQDNSTNYTIQLQNVWCRTAAMEHCRCLKLTLLVLMIMLKYCTFVTAVVWRIWCASQWWWRGSWQPCRRTYIGQQIIGFFMQPWATGCW